MKEGWLALSVTTVCAVDVVLLSGDDQR